MQKGTDCMQLINTYISGTYSGIAHGRTSMKMMKNRKLEKYKIFHIKKCVHDHIVQKMLG